MFFENLFPAIRIKNLNSENGKYTKKKFREIDSFNLTSFLAWTFLNFLVHCVVNVLTKLDSFFV